jgi:hypothetical protein
MKSIQEKTAETAKNSSASSIKPAIDRLKELLQNVYSSKQSITPEIELEIIELISGAKELFTDFGATFLPVNRQRLIGARIKNYGFLRTAFQIAAQHPDFVPHYLNVDNFRIAIDNFEAKRNIVQTLEVFLQQAKDGMLASGNASFRNALELYSYIKEAARRGVPGAEALNDELSVYFNRGGSYKKEQPTAKQVERDARALLHGKKDGEIVIKNKRPHLSGGKQEVIDAMSL